MGCDRNVRDAYFHGIVVAAFADDRKVDMGEQAIVNSVGASLELGKDEIADVIAFVEKCGEKLVLLKECCRQLTDMAIVKLFACEFTKVWVSHPDAMIKDLADYWKDYFSLGIAAKLPIKMMQIARQVLENVSDAADEDLVALADWMGEDVLRYLVLYPLGDIASRLKNRRQKVVRRRQRHLDAEREKLQEALKRIAKHGADMASINQDRLDYINEEVAGIEADAIDFPAEFDRVVGRIKRALSGECRLIAKVRGHVLCLFALTCIVLDCRRLDYAIVQDCNRLLKCPNSVYDKSIEFRQAFFSGDYGKVSV